MLKVMKKNKIKKKEEEKLKIIRELIDLIFYMKKEK
jgi:hypothetical protein